MADTYLIDRKSTKESQRLDTQHRVYTRALGYKLHPSITSTLPEDACVADIGTGTSIFLQELVSKHPSWQLHGFDVSNEAFPADTIPNIQLHVHDTKMPFPCLWHGRFDVVHIRLLTAAMSCKEDWEIVAQNIVALLKPGGRVQWVEGDYNAVVLRSFAAPGPNANTTTLQTVLRRMFAVGGYSTSPDFAFTPRVGDCFAILDAFSQNPLHDVVVDCVSSDRELETRPDATRVYIAAALHMLSGRLGEKLQIKKDNVVKWAEEAEREIRKGWYIRYNMHCIIATRV